LSVTTVTYPTVTMDQAVVRDNGGNSLVATVNSREKGRIRLAPNGKLRRSIETNVEFIHALSQWLKGREE
jgi:hypothetical protein